MCGPADAPGPRLRDRAFPTSRTPSVQLPGQGNRSGCTTQEGSSAGVSLVRQKPKTSEEAVVSAVGMVRHSPALEFKSPKPKTASSVGLSLLTLRVSASTPSSPPASSLKRQTLHWTALCARPCSECPANPSQCSSLTTPAGDAVTSQVSPGKGPGWNVLSQAGCRVQVPPCGAASA